MDQTFMKDRNVFSLVVSMSMPMVLSMLVNSLYNIVDSYFVARISEQAMTSLSLVFPLQLLENAIAVGFGIGINVTAAYYLGAGRNKDANDVISSGIILSILHGAILTVGILACVKGFLSSFSENEQIIAYGITYSNIVFAFTILNTVAITFEKIFQAEGQMKVSMFSMLCGCIANIVLDPLMIFGIGPFPEMGISGAALATGIGQVIPLIVYILIYIKKPLPLRVKFHRGMFNSKSLKRVYGVGIPAALNIALPSFMITALNGIMAAYSDIYILVLGIYYKLQTFIYLTANGIIQGIRPIIGYNYGAKEYGRVKKVFYTALSLTAVIMLIGTIICLLFAAQLTGLFTTNPTTIEAGKTAIRIISAGFIVSAVSVTAGGALEGEGKGMQSLIISLLRYIVLIIPTAYIFGKLWGPDAIWNCFWFAETVTAVVSWILYKREEKNWIGN